MRKILLFGATGRTGGLVINYALEKGYSVVALVRSPDKIKVQSPQLTVIKGSPTDANDVRLAMKGCDAVISALSALSEKESFSFKKIEPPHVLETTIRNAIDSMKANHVRRIITLSSIGAGNSFNLAPWYMRLIIRITNFKIVFADHTRQETLLQQSDLDWTIARPVALTNGTELKKLVVSYHKTPSPFHISRSLLAKFLVDCIDDASLIGKTPILSEHA
ncbi:SDR family oxidoreductase [Mucilaginibacter sp. Bleaf8]|uniref:NAD(P)-dependent oxidoreductase n=1 Tax=Mucilaginibacter sp. Bleaf8 TaxID=2834430 RepID=UPI001BD011BF|nr:NAD(P)-binding oxidoreductase [Mucilaginibacter sp. Bleaf8]MBS7564744.1 SDR family oxidoreductase [Mucilaginibacter sp. Bleaf8]